MNPEYDFEQEMISEMMPSISIPAIVLADPSSRSGPILDLERYLLDQKHLEQTKIQLLKQRQQYIGEQVEKQLANKQKKLQQLEKLEKERLLSECTFQPKTSSKKGQKRNLNEFLQQQQQFTQKVMQKRDTLRRTLEEGKEKETHHPTINRKASGKKKQQDKSVFERLYGLREKENEEDNCQVGTFCPQITQKSKKMSRNAPIEDLLYGDALRRQEKVKDQDGLLARKVQQIRPEKAVNLNNEKYAAQKFIREYFQSLQKLGMSQGADKVIEYVAFGQLLTDLGFVKGDEHDQSYVSTEQRALVHEAYQLLEGKRVNAKNVCVFLLGLIGIYHINPVNFAEGDQSDPANQFSLDQPQGRKMQRRFDRLKRNRLSSEAKRRAKDGKPQQACSFHPTINPQSQEMAEKHRQQMLTAANQLLQDYPQLDYAVPQDGIITHTDLLVLNNLVKEYRVQQQKQDKNKKEIESCTFKPITLGNSMEVSKMTEPGLGCKKSLELYAHHKSLQTKKDSLKGSRRDQPGEECTFTPNLNRPKVSVKGPPLTSSKQISEALFRLHKGRQEHQQKRKFLERGETTLKRKQQDKRSHGRSIQTRQHEEPQDVPTLILDVNLGSQMDRIVICKQDECRLEAVARQFAEKHNLSADNQVKLNDLLRIELDNVLAKIQEDEESENGRSDCQLREQH